MASKPKPALSRWMIDHRKERGETVEDIARVTDRSAATVRGWEAGRPPLADDPVVAHLERHWGAVAPREGVPDDLAAAIRDQADAIRVLVEELRLARLDQVEATDALLRGLAAVVPLDRERSGTPNGSGHGAPLGTPQ